MEGAKRIIERGRVRDKLSIKKENTDEDSCPKHVDSFIKNI